MFQVEHLTWNHHLTSLQSFHLTIKMPILPVANYTLWSRRRPGSGKTQQNLGGNFKIQISITPTAKNKQQLICLQFDSRGNGRLIYCEIEWCLMKTTKSVAIFPWIKKKIQPSPYEVSGTLKMWYKLWHTLHWKGLNRHKIYTSLHYLFLHVWCLNFTFQCW